MTADNREHLKALRRAWYIKNKLARLTRSHERYAANKQLRVAQARACQMRRPSLYLWRTARRRATVNGLPFTITPDDIVIPTHCPVLGIRLEFGDRTTAPSLDRHIPQLGYVPGNVVVMSNRANILKRDGTTDEILALGAYLKARDAA